MFIQPSVFLQLSLLNNYFNYSRTSSYIFVTETLHKYEKRCFPGNCRCYEARYNKDEMKLWYFDIASFKPESGFEFEFTAGSPEKSYLHKCKVTEVVVGKKLSYSWRYDGYPGNSFVTFELFEEGNKTKLKLTHEGLETFPRHLADFAKESFAKGWTHIISISLKDFVEK